jgi:hypothetical protein
MECPAVNTILGAYKKALPQRAEICWLNIGTTLLFAKLGVPLQTALTGIIGRDKASEVIDKNAINLLFIYTQ